MNRAELVAADLGKPHWGNHEANLRFLEEAAFFASPRVVLEVGSGKGHMLEYLARRGHATVGIDIDPELVTESRRLSSELCVLVASGVDLPFEDAVFDAVVSFDVFEHIPRSDRYIQEVWRVLKPGGEYLFETPNKWMNVLFEPIRFARKYGVSKTFTFLEFPHHCALHNLWQLRRRLERQHFAVRFLRVPVVTEFFRQKMRRFLGALGPLALKVVNPDKLPLPLATNFHVVARKNTVGSAAPTPLLEPTKA